MGATTMMDVLQIEAVLDLIKAREGVSSYYAVAKRLDISEQVVSNWRHGRSFPDDLTAAKLAAAAGLDVHVFVAQCHAARAPNREVERLWLAIAERLAAAS